MSRRYLSKRDRGAGGQPSAPFLVWLLLAALAIYPAAAQDDLRPELTEFAGMTLQQLAAQPGVAPTLRSVVRGRQEVIFRHLRAPGNPVQAADGYAWAWGCNGGDCPREGLFLAYEPSTDNLWMLLVREGELDRQVPPRGSPWPERLVRAVSTQRPDLGTRVSRVR